MNLPMVLFLLLHIRLTLKTLIGRERAYSQYTLACEVDMITQCLQRMLSHQVEFKVCLVSKSHFYKRREKYLLLQIV